MKIYEIFKSIQGESTYQGLPCTFIRVSGCNLRCKFCDTQEALKRGTELSVAKIIEYIEKAKTNLIEVTGGEPLLQPDIYELLQVLVKKHTVLVETNGSIDIKDLPPEVIKIIDVKCPSSGMSSFMLFSNLNYLSELDEVKFVIWTKRDYDYAKEIIKKYNLSGKKILFSPVHKKLSPKKLAKWILEDNLPVRLQIQLHKYIFGKKEGITLFRA